MHPFSDIADWWDGQHKQSEEILGEFVEDHPTWWAIGAATALSTSMQLGAGLVDVLRLGKGVEEGGVKGYGKDALRVLQLAGPVAKLSRFALAKVMTDPAGGVCTWATAAKALRQTGTKHFATIEDLAGSAQKSVSSLGGAYVNEVLPAMKALGAKVQSLGTLKNLDEVANATKATKGVVMFSVEWVTSQGQRVGHTLYAYKSMLGGFRIADRSGKIVSKLDDLKGYGNIGSATVYGTAARIEQATVATMTGVGSTLALEVNAKLLADHHTTRQSLAIRGQASRGAIPDAKSHTVSSGESLSSLAAKYYGSPMKWPLLYGANRKAIGSDPSLIKPGLKVTVPPPPRIDGKA